MISHAQPVISATIVNRNATVPIWNPHTNRKFVIMSLERAHAFPERPDHFVINLAPRTLMVQTVLILALV